MSQVPEESFTQASYRNTFRSRFEFEHVTVLGSDANGTHFQWDDARGERHFGVISDLTGFKIVRAGSEPVTILLGAKSQTDNFTLSPALPGAIGDYLAFASAGPVGATFLTAFASLTTLSNLQVIATREYTDDSGGDFNSEVAFDDPINGHQHNNLAGHVAAAHALTTAGTAAQTTNVRWMIVLA